MRLFFSVGSLFSMVAAAKIGLMRCSSGGSSRRAKYVPVPTTSPSQSNSRPQNAQPSDDEPMIDQRGGKEIGEHADGQHDQSGGDVDRFDLASRLAQTLIDEAFALGRRRTTTGVCDGIGGGVASSTRHGESPRQEALPLPL